jgi:hypothetical protein
VSLPLGTALVATWTFTASGVLHDPSPVPTVIEASYPDGTVLAGLPLALTKIRTGVYQAQIFSTGQVTQVGTYSALAYSSDTALDSPYGDGQAVWQDVGVNSVSALTSTALASVLRLRRQRRDDGGVVGQVRRWIRWRAIVSQTDLIGQIEITLAAPVVGFQIVPLITNRSYKNSLGNPVTFTVTGLAFSLLAPGIAIKMNVAVNGGTPQAFTGTATSATAGLRRCKTRPIRSIGCPPEREAVFRLGTDCR